MSKQDKTIAWILILQGSMALVTLAYTLLVSPSPSTFVWLAPLSVLSIGAGTGMLRSKRWAYILGIVVILFQIPAIKTPWFSYFLWLGFQLKIYIGSLGSWQIGINLFALAVLVWIAYRYNAPNNSFKPSPHQVGA